MIRKLLIITLLLAATYSYAQDNGKATITPAPPVKIDYTQIGAPMPDMLLISLDSITEKEETSGRHKRHHKVEQDTLAPKTRLITNSDFEHIKGNLFVMMFNPTCGHCVNETDLLVKNMDLFKNSKIVFICNPVMRSYLPDFVKAHRIKEFPQMSAGVDSIGFMGKAFLYRMLPQINIYDKNKKLLKIFTGDVPIDSLKDFIQ